MYVSTTTAADDDNELTSVHVPSLLCPCVVVDDDDEGMEVDAEAATETNERRWCQFVMEVNSNVGSNDDRPICDDERCDDVGLWQFSLEIFLPTKRQEEVT